METKNFFEVWPGIFLFDFLRYLIPASIAFVVFWVVGKNWWRHRFIQSTFPRSSQFWKEFGYSMSTVLIFSIIGYGVFKADHAGLTQIYHRIDEHGIGYMIFSFAIMLVYHDFYFYWTHRFMHHKRIFRYVHKVHHESTNPSPWAAYSFHPWEAVIQALVLPIAVFILPLHPLTIFIFLTYMILRNVAGHLGFEILPKGFTKSKWLGWNTAVTHHNMHHEHFHSNYGLYFSWWDKLMKTEHKNYHKKFEEVTSRPKSRETKLKPKKAVVVTMLILFSIVNMSGQSITGRWTTYNEQTGSPLSVIEITETSGSLVGNVRQIFLEPYQGEDPVCSKCSGDRKDKKVINMNFLWGFKPDADEWSSGKILDPESGETYSGKLWQEDANILHVRGYGGPLGLFYRTQTWKRLGNATEKNPIGLWQTIDDHSGKVKSLIEIKKENGELNGFIRKIYLQPYEGTDPICNRCNGELKNSKVVGLKIIWDFKKDGNKWVDGKILDPGNGNIYASSLWLVDADTLKVRGYLGPFYRSQIWKRSR